MSNKSRLVTNKEKAEVLNDFLASVLTGNYSSQPTWTDWSEVHNRWSNVPSFVRKIIRFLMSWGTSNSMGTDEMNPNPEGIGCYGCEDTLSDIWKVTTVKWSPQWLEKRQCGTHFFRRVKRITQGQSVILAIVPGNIMGQILLEAMITDTEERKVIVILWHWPRGAQSTVMTIVAFFNLFYSIKSPYMCGINLPQTNKSKCSEFKNEDNIFKTKVHNCRCITAKNSFLN